jgi:hypothetical protein
MTARSATSVPSFDLAGKRALITGGSRGIGLAAAEALAAFGAHVTLAARPSADLSAAVEKLKAGGQSADALELDVTDTARVKAAILERAPFDILVNNAGTNQPVTFLEVTEAQYDTIMTLNVRAAYFVAQAVAQRLVAAGRPGSIINVSSQMGHVGAATRTVYCASLPFSNHRCTVVVPAASPSSKSCPFSSKEVLRTELCPTATRSIGVSRNNLISPTDIVIRPSAFATVLSAIIPIAISTLRIMLPLSLFPFMSSERI